MNTTNIVHLTSTRNLLHLYLNNTFLAYIISTKLLYYLIFLTFDCWTDMGVERGIRLEGLSEAQISKALEDLLKVGEALKKAWLIGCCNLYVENEIN